MKFFTKIQRNIIDKLFRWPIPHKEDRELKDIHLRDPFIIRDENGGYVLTGTIYHYNWNDSNQTVIYKSKDLVKWNGPYKIVDGNTLDGIYYDFWAPEIHKIKDKYYLLVTLSPKDKKRGTYLFECDTIDGQYKMLCRLTPQNQNCLDATVYIENGECWITYCYEWLDCIDGEIRTVKLNEDMRGVDTSTDRLLFKASANKYKPRKTKEKVTDGPFFYRKDDTLYLLWSTSLINGKYAQLLAKSDNGSIYGNFTQDGILFEADGGHGMIFTTYQNKQCLILHMPNGRKLLKNQYEHPEIMNVELK